MANPFSRFLEWSKKLSLSHKPESVIAVDIGSSSIKVIQLRKEHGKAILETYGELSTGPYGDLAVGQAVTLGQDKILEALHDLFREANVTATSGCMAIPLRSSLLVAIEIPKLPKDELASAIPIEARKFVPVPISEVALDWWVIPEREDRSPVYHAEEAAPKKTLEVLIAAIHRDTVKLYEEVGKAMELGIDFFEIETFSAIRSSLTNDLSATAIVDFGAGTTKVAIIDYGVVRVSHTINKGAQDLTAALSRSLNVPFDKAEEIKRKVGLVEQVTASGEVSGIISPIIEFILAEVNRVIIGYQAKQRRAVEKVLVIGGGALLPGFAELAQRTMQMNVVMGNPFEKVESPAFLENTLREAGPVFAVSLGLALRKLQDI